MPIFHKELDPKIPQNVILAYQNTNSQFGRKPVISMVSMSMRESNKARTVIENFRNVKKRHP